MTAQFDSSLQQRLRALRVDPPDDGFSQRLHEALEREQAAGKVLRPAFWRRRRGAVLLSIAALCISGGAFGLMGGGGWLTHAMSEPAVETVEVQAPAAVEAQQAVRPRRVIAPVVEAPRPDAIPEVAAEVQLEPAVAPQLAVPRGLEPRTRATGAPRVPSETNARVTGASPPLIVPQVDAPPPVQAERSLERPERPLVVPKLRTELRRNGQESRPEVKRQRPRSEARPNPRERRRDLEHERRNRAEMRDRPEPRDRTPQERPARRPTRR